MRIATGSWPLPRFGILAPSSRITASRAALLAAALLIVLVPSLVAAAPVAGSATTTVPPAATLTWQDIVRIDQQAPQLPAAPRIAPIMPAPPPRPLGTPLTAAVPTGMVAPSPGPVPESGPEPPYPLGPESIPQVTMDFQAIHDNGTFIPPDTHGAVGPSHVMTTLNSQTRIQDRAGNIISTVSTGSFWAPLGSTNTSDPKILYDRMTGRWVYSILADPATSTAKNFLAVTRTSDPTGIWDYYAIPSDPSGLIWSDYDCIGLNNTWIAITANMFTVSTQAYVGAKMWVVNKALLMQPSPVLSYTTFNVGFDSAGGAAGFTLHPCLTFDPSVAKLYVVDNSGYQDGATFLVRISEISGTGAAPVWAPTAGSAYPGTGQFAVANNFNFNQITASQKGTPHRISTNDPRMMQPVFRNGHIWCTHSAGLPVGPTAANRTVVCWYELDPAAMPSPIVQSGIIQEGSGTHVYFPSIAANGTEDVLIGFSRSDPTRYAEAAYAIRLSTDPSNTMRSIRALKCGENQYYKTFGGSVNRWGDYSATVVDPVDDTGLWTIQEYASTPANSWSTWWGQVPLPMPADPAIATAYTGFANLGYTGAGTMNLHASVWCPGDPPVLQSHCDLAPGIPANISACDACNLLASAVNNSPGCTALGFTATCNGGVVTVANPSGGPCPGSFARFDPAGWILANAAVDSRSLAATIPLRFTLVGLALNDSVPPGNATVTVVHTLRHAPAFQPVTYRADVHPTLGMQPSAIVSALAASLTGQGDLDVQAAGRVLRVYPHVVGDPSPPAGQDFDLTVRNNDKGLGFAVSPLDNPFALLGIDTTGTSSAPVAVVTAGTGFDLEWIGPNPTAARTVLRFAIPVRGLVRADIYDAGGRRVRNLADGVFAPGELLLEWDGRAEGGREVGGGVYFVRGRFTGDGGQIGSSNGRIIIRE